jgi:hypothetical protein
LAAIHGDRLAAKSGGTKPVVGFRFSYFAMGCANNGRVKKEKTGLVSQGMAKEAGEFE